MESAKESKSSSWMKWAGLGCLGMVVLFVGAIGLGFKAFETVKVELTPVLTEFIQALEAEDIEAAQKLAVEGAMSDEDIGRLAAMTYLFEGFASVTVESGKISKNVNTDERFSGTLAEATGKVHYQNEETGTFKVGAKKVDDQWRILNISVNISAERYDRLKTE
ncbi:MAG: hypothetical protein WC423_21505 [Vulcanimicrobiota bacterium]